MERARKRLASAFDGIMAQFGDDSQEETTSIVDSTVRNEFMQKEKIKSENCRLARIVRHGFPDGPKCMAFDPVQKLLAIGAARGCVRLFGQAGVDQLLKHESEESVMQIQFLINEGGLVTALQDDTLHLWNYRQRIPEVVHSLRMSKERITAMHLPFQSKWLIVGTDKGNIYFVSLSSFELSNQIIYWNKAVDMTCRTHPGSIRLIESSPIEPSKLLILFDKGPVVLWNCITKEVDRFTAASELNPVTAVSWNNDAKQILCGHQNGSLSIWNVKKPKELVHRSFPHSSPDDLSSPIPCKAINQLYWNTNADGEMIVFTGGMPSDEGSLPSLTVLRTKGSLTVLEMDHAIVSMLPLNSTPYASVSQLPSAIAVLLKNDLLVVDMTAQGYPCFEIPHPMDLHESPVTILRYYSDCPLEMIAALTLAGRNQRRQGVRLSDKQWPISGGIGRECATGHQEIFLTGHEDGSIKFWQASSEQLQILYKLKSGRHFEKSSTSKLLQQNANTSEKQHIAMVSHAVAYLELCMHSRFLLVASSSGQVTLFHFAKTECCQTITVIPLPQLCRSTMSLFSPSGPLSPPPENLDNVTSNQNRLQQSMSSGSNGSQKGELKRQGPVSEPQFSKDSSQSIDSQMADFMPLKVRAGALRRPAGYQPEIVCQIPWINGLRPEPITALSLNSSYGLIAMGTAFGLALIDTKEAMICKTWSNMQLFEPMAPLCTALTSQDVQQIFTPSNEGHSPSKTLLTQPASTPIQRPNSSRSLRARLKHQFSTQMPPVPPPKSPGPLFRGNTTDSIQDNNRLLTVGSRLQRPQLMKAFTFNPTNLNSNNNDDELKTASIGDSAASPLNKPSQQNCNGNLSLDSHASSIESLEKMGMLVQQQNAQEWVNECEFVSFIQFINSPDKRGVTEPCIWLGTSYGASLFIQLNLLTKNTSSVNIAPSESFRLHGRIIHMAFLDRNFCLLNGPSENYKNVQQERTTKEALSQISIGSTEESGGLEEKDKKGLEGEQNKSNKARKKWELLKAKVLTKTNQSPKLASPAEKHEENFSQLAFFIAESEIRAVALPNNKQLFERYFFAKSPDEIPLVRAYSSHVCGQPILAALNAAGAIIVLSLPSLRSLMCSALFPHSVDIDDRICHRFELSENGLGIYMISPSEVQKFTISSDIAVQMTDCMGELFIPCDMPEPPKQQSFFRGVMSTLAAAAGANSSSCGYAIEQLIEMDTILSEKPASSMGTSQVRTVAKPLFTQQQQNQQLGGIETGTSKTLTAGQAAKEAMQNLAERNERLNAVTDATEQLRMNAEQIQNRSAKLLDKYEKKKWFQL